MGYLAKDYVDRGGRKVLQALKSRNSVNYMDIAIDEKTGDWIDDPDMPTLAIDVAIDQLVDAGLRKLQDLAETMPDGFQHYRIDVTGSGADFLRAERDFLFQGVDL